MIRNKHGVKMRAGVMAIPGVFLILNSAVTAPAQERPNGFYLTSPLSLSAGSDNGFVAGPSKFDDTVTLVTGPAFTWFTSTHRTDWSVNYQPELEFFTRHDEFDAWNHSSLFRLAHQINSRWSIHSGNSFLSTMDPSRQLNNSFLLLPRSRFLQNTFYTDATYRLNRATKFTFRFDDAVTTTDLSGVLAKRIDQVTNAGTVTVDRDLTSKQKLSGTYSFLRVLPLHPEVAGGGTNVNVMIAGYAYEINPRLIINLTAGGVQSPQFAFNGSAAVQKQVGSLWLAAGYQRYLGFFGALTPSGQPAGTIPFANGLTPSSVYQVATIRAWGNLTKRIGLEGSAQKALNGIVVQGQNVRSLVGQIRLDYKLNDRFVLFARAEHYGQNVNLFTEERLSRNRYFGGIEIVLSRPPEPGNARYRHGKAPQDSDDLKAKEPQLQEQP
jgi:hypothetical protein